MRNPRSCHRVAAAVALAALLVAALSVGAQAPAVAGADTRNVAERLGYPADARLLVIHADDVGMMSTVNRATFEAFENGWITSASILVVAPWFPEVAQFAARNPDADFGVHLALTSEWSTLRWGPVSPRALVPTLVDAEGYLPRLAAPVLERASLADAEQELRAQFERARAAGIRISHLDSHMATLFQRAEFFALYGRVGRAYGIPVLFERAEPGRNVPGYDRPHPPLVDRVLDIKPGVAAERWLETYQEMLAPLPPGVYQLIVHLGYDDAELRAATFDHPDWGAAWRQNDFDTVRNPAFHRFLREQNFILVSWRDLARALPEDWSTAPPQ
jgi:predicted glycoside hydrolase/deacetylase ChbG (UPF0249 family)